MKKKYATQAEIEAIQQRVDQQVEDCVKFAEESPYPSDDELYKDIYAEADYPFLTE